MGEIVLEDRVYRQVSERGEAERLETPIPVSVGFDRPSGRIIVEFSNGAAFMVPARSLQYLEDAKDSELSEVELLGETGLHWEALDVDYTICGADERHLWQRQIHGCATPRRPGLDRRPRLQQAVATGAKGGRPRKIGI
jgi:hypothetical protein